MRELTQPPPISVLSAYGARDSPTRFTAGRGRTWAAGDVVLKPAEDDAESTWIANFAASLPQRGFRLALPIASRDGRWVVQGWTAWTRLEGEHSTSRWPELLRAADAFHEATRSVPKPEFIARQGEVRISRLDRWRLADQIVWGDRPAGDLVSVRHVGPLLEDRRELDMPSQLIHGDLVGNVLFADGMPPAIIDLSLYWRPVGYSAALAIGDALTWEGASPEVVELLKKFADWPQLLLRAVLFRVLVNELARRAEPSRADLSSEYDAIVRTTLAAVSEARAAPARRPGEL